MKNYEGLTCWENPRPKTNQREEDKIYGNWVEPQEYFIGAKTHEGKLDKDCIEVYNSETYEQVAEFSNHVNPEYLGELAIELGKKYNDAMIVVEIGGHGITVLNYLQTKNYNPLYCEVRRELDAISYGCTQIVKMGWETTEQNKFKMIDDLAKFRRENTIKVNSKDLIREMKSYMRADGETKPQAGSYDNRVIATAICLQAIIKHRKWDHIHPKELIKTLTPHERALEQLLGKQKEQESMEDLYS